MGAIARRSWSWMGYAAKSAKVVLQRLEGVFQPGLANLFEAVVITSSAAHSIQILWNNRVIVIRQGEPIEFLVSVITRSRSHPQADKASIDSGSTSRLGHCRKISNDDIRSRD